MTIHHGGCHWLRALYQVAVAHAYAKKTPVPKIKVIFSLFSSHNTNLPQRSSQAKTRQKRLRGRLQKSLSSVSSSIWPIWSTFFQLQIKHSDYSLIFQIFWCWKFFFVLFLYFRVFRGFHPIRGMFRGIQGCSEVVLGMFQGVVGIFGVFWVGVFWGVPGLFLVLQTRHSTGWNP